MDVFNKELYMARQIYNSIKKVKDFLEEDEFTTFISMATSIPSYIKKNGLFNTLAFLIKDKEDENASGEMINVYAYWIINNDMIKLYNNLELDEENVEDEEYDQFLKSIENMITKEYMSFSINSLEFFTNLKIISENFKEYKKE